VTPIQLNNSILKTTLDSIKIKIITIFPNVKKIELLNYLCSNIDKY